MNLNDLHRLMEKKDAAELSPEERITLVLGVLESVGPLARPYVEAALDAVGATACERDTKRRRKIRRRGKTISSLERTLGARRLEWECALELLRRERNELRLEVQRLQAFEAENSALRAERERLLRELDIVRASRAQRTPRGGIRVDEDVLTKLRSSLPEGGCACEH